MAWLSFCGFYCPLRPGFTSGDGQRKLAISLPALNQAEGRMAKPLTALTPVGHQRSMSVIETE